MLLGFENRGKEKKRRNPTDKYGGINSDGLQEISKKLNDKENSSSSSSSSPGF